MPKPKYDWRVDRTAQSLYANVRAQSEDVDQAAALTDLSDYLVRAAVASEIAAQSAPLRTVEQVAEALGAYDEGEWYSIAQERGKNWLRSSCQRMVFARVVAASQSSAPPTEEK